METSRNVHTIPTAIDLFAGAGGLSEGLQEAGFTILYANEIKARYSETYAYNHSETVVDQRDIRNVDEKKIREQLKIKKGELALLAGGPPCQGFSINAPIRSNGDARNHLFKDFLRFAKEFQPKSVLIENVPGLVSYSKGETLSSILLSLEDLGYKSDLRILYAPHYGVPQTRWRTIIIGLSESDDVASAFPDHVCYAPLRVNFTSRFEGRNIVSLPSSLELPRHVSVEDAIGDLSILQNGESGDEEKEYRVKFQNTFQEILRAGSTCVVNHQAAKLSSINMNRLSYIPQGGNWTDIPNELLPKGMQRARISDHTKRYGRVHAGGLASTILTKCDPHWGAFFHYDQDRAFTVREAARIQTFPDTFRFLGSRVEQYEQVGNAVPPMLAAAIGQTLSRVLGAHNNELKRVI